MKIITTGFRLIPMVCKAEPVLFMIVVLLAAPHGLSYGMVTWCTQRLFDSASVLADQQASVGPVMRRLAALGLAYAVSQILHGIFHLLYRALGRRAQGQLGSVLNQKMGRLSPVCFEDTVMLDNINKASEGMNNAVWFTLTFLGLGTFYVPYLLFMGYYLFTLKPVLAVVILLAFIPMAVSQIFRAEVYGMLENELAPARRANDYYESCIVGREYVKETRLLGAFGYFYGCWMETLRRLNRLRIKAGVRTNLFELGMKLITIGSYAVILYMLFTAVIRKEISIGAFATVFASAERLFSLMHELVCGNITYLTEDLGSIRHFFTFLDLPERAGRDTDIESVSPAAREIVADGVSFRYPQAKRDAVRGVSLHIKSGETIAIVGENGSGKSTLLRLLTGLYLPTSGHVCIDDVDISEISMSALFTGVSAVFQKYQRYQLTLRENIGLSESNRPCADAALDRVMEDAGFERLSGSFPDGYDTMLSREFGGEGTGGGVELSGGQWQRVAIGRGLFRRHTFIVLDEPTAAIDPLEETEIYNRFGKLVKDRTAVIVTHRLGMVKMADRIFVMSKGRLAEAGTHDELMRQGGEYARLYCAQRQWYR